jgi:hypothetical protein
MFIKILQQFLQNISPDAVSPIVISRGELIDDSYYDFIIAEQAYTLVETDYASDLAWLAKDVQEKTHHKVNGWVILQDKRSNDKPGILKPDTAIDDKQGELPDNYNNYMQITHHSHGFVYLLATRNN